MLPEPLAGEVQSLLRDYVAVRLEAVDPVKTSSAIARSEDLHKALWEKAVVAVQQDRSPITGLFVQTLNDTIDLHAKRLLVGLRSRIPSTIWIALYLVTFLSMGVMGYFEGITSRSRSLVAVPLVLTFAIVICLIADLDRPGEGLLRVGQQPMTDLQKSFAETSARQP